MRCVLGGLPVRQWVLTLPFRLRYRLAYDHRLCRRVMLREQLVSPDTRHERIDAVSALDDARSASLHDLVKRLAS